MHAGSAIGKPPGDNSPMALRLFRSTGYSTLLMPGETRRSTHPAQVVLGASLWLGVVCNVAVWRLLTGQGEPRHVLASIAFLTGVCGVVFSVFGWRRTLKPVVTLFLAAGAVLACGLWSQQLPVETLWQESVHALWVSWPSFMRWQVLAIVAVLGLVPMVWLWNMPLRRLPGPAQLRVNLLGAVIAAGIAAAAHALPL